MTEIDDLRSRMKQLVLSNCNTVGCAKCGLKWEGGCSATDLENRIRGIEMKQLTDNTSKESRSV